LKPDFITTAKGITSAYFPMSAVLVTDDIYDVLVKTTRTKGVFSHGFTYSGHPVGAAVALETIAILQERDIPGHVRKVGEYFQSKVRDLVKFPLVGNTRGIGMMAGFDLFADVPTKSKFARETDVGTLLTDIAEKHHLFIRCVGDSVVLAPPLIITESEVDELIERLSRALQALISTTAMR
jgi:4-aminobutyrate--pyruvate transaminase